MRSLVVIPIGLLVGFAAGYAFFRGPSPLAPVTTVSLRESEASSAPVARPDVGGATDEKTQRLLAAVLHRDGSIARDAELYEAIEALTAADFRRIAADLGALRTMADQLRTLDYRTGQVLATALIQHWLEVDPDTVLAWAPRVSALIPGSEVARTNIFCALAEKRPEQALAIAEAMKDPSDHAEMLHPAIFELAGLHPEKARAWLARCTDPDDRRIAEKAIRLATVQADPLRAVELASATTNREDAERLMHAATQRATSLGLGMLRQLAETPMPGWMLKPVLYELNERDPELAVDLAVKSGVDFGDENAGLNMSFWSLAERDTPVAISKLDALTGAARANAIDSIASAWAVREPEAALAWVAAQPDSRGALTRAFERWVWRSDFAARAWADALPAGDTRDALQLQLAQSLGRIGKPADAVQVLARAGHAAAPQTLDRLAGEWAAVDPRAAADWAIAQPLGPAQSSALAGVVGAWAGNDPHAVESWLAQFPPGDARDRSVAAFLGRVGGWTRPASEKVAEFDTWFDLIEDPWQRAQVAAGNFRARYGRDPETARAWLTSLSNVDPEIIRRTLRDADEP